LLKNVEKFQAIGRLKYEMQFAFELTGLSFFELMQPIQSPIPDDINKALAKDLISSTVISIGLDRMIGKSAVVLDIKKKIKKYADIQRPILVIGETGAGKEIVARAIHEESTHKNKPFLAINCGALTDTLLQSELFGYEAGAFTGAVTPHKGIFEAAEDGVVFMDEFGEMSPKLQVSLLRVLENNEVMKVGGTKVKKINCQIIAATNANIDELISKKLFREDLYHRLKQFTISIPPLRERKEDLPELINYFFNQQNNNQKQELSKELMLAFQEYHWPGNIRELKNEIDRIKILCGYKPIIEMQDIELEWLKKNTDLNSIKNLASEKKESSNSDTEQMHQRILDKKLSKSDKRLQQIKVLFQQYKQLTRGQIAAALQISLITTSKDLDHLCEEGFIIKRMPSKCLRSYYFELVINTTN
jgi:transcriptional regulator with PAS, ATPase and Fis domain